MPTKGSRCSIGYCFNTSSKAKAAGMELMFFSFPKDPAIRKQWIYKCGRKDHVNADTARICSAHFSEDDYEDALKAKIMGFRPRKLYKHAVPSLLLSPPSVKKKSARKKGKYSEMKERREIINNLLKADSAEETVNTPMEVEPEVVSTVVNNTTIEEPVPSSISSELEVEGYVIAEEPVAAINVCSEVQEIISSPGTESQQVSSNPPSQELDQDVYIIIEQGQPVVNITPPSQFGDGSIQVVNEPVAGSILTVSVPASGSNPPAANLCDSTVIKRPVAQGKNTTKQGNGSTKKLASDGIEIMNQILLKVKALEVELAKLKKTNASLTDIMAKKDDLISSLSARIVELEEQAKAGGTFEDKMKAALQDCLSPNQIEIMLKRKTKARWSQDELAKAFALRYFSQRSYLFVREKLKYPLPGPSTLRKWASSVDLDTIQNILPDVQDILARGCSDEMN